MKEIPLTQGMVAIVDDEDYEELACHKWYFRKYGKGYAARGIWDYEKKKQFVFDMHRIITNAPTRVPVDHANGNTLDNRRSNLRICTAAENQRNRPNLPNTSSRYKGVSRSKRGARLPWQTQICVDGKSRWLGYYSSEEEAARTYDRAARLYFGEFAYLNFPEEVEQ